MIARFFVYLPFDLFITEDEQLGVQGLTEDGEFRGARFTIPVSLLYSERPDSTGSMHSLMFNWLTGASSPQFSDYLLQDGRRVARVNVLGMDLFNDDFPRSSDTKAEDDPTVSFAFELMNQFLARLRVYSRAPQIKPLVIGTVPWQVQFLADSGAMLPKEERKRRALRGGSANIGVPILTPAEIKLVSDKWDGPEPYVWDELLLDAHSLWPDVGSAIVMASAALETFITWALNVLQTDQKAFSTEFWEWLTKRDDWLKQPSVAENFDQLLKALTTHSLKEKPELWTKFKEIRRARNSLVHEGIPKAADGARLGASQAQMLLNAADEIVLWVESLLPDHVRRAKNASTIQFRRKFLTEEEEKLFPSAKGGEGESNTDSEIGTE